MLKSGYPNYSAALLNPLTDRISTNWLNSEQVADLIVFTDLGTISRSYIIFFKTGNLPKVNLYTEKNNHKSALIH